MSRELLRPFEEYQKARINFVQTIADLASKSQNIEALNATEKNLIAAFHATESYNKTRGGGARRY